MLISSLVSCGNSAEKQAESAASAENPVVETIMARRSIRNYKPDVVGRDTLEAILKCGINAPNGQNKQSWEVRVVDNPETMAKIKAIIDEASPADADRKMSDCFRGAPVMVFIARDTTYVCSPYDCGLLAGNIMLTAQSMGVGSICLGSPAFVINDNPACKPVLEMLGFSDNYVLSICVGLGYANESPEAKPRDWNKVKFMD